MLRVSLTPAFAACKSGGCGEARRGTEGAEAALACARLRSPELRRRHQRATRRGTHRDGEWSL